VVLARPYRTLMPTYAKDVMGFGCAGLGMLTAAPELGSLLSSVAMASLGRFRGKGKLLLVAGTVLGASLLVFGNVRVLGLVLFFLILAGFMNNICLVVTQTLLQVNAEDQFLGRVMSLQIMMSGLVPLGALPASAIADRAGVPVAVSALGALLVAIFGVVALLPRVRRLE
jgi:MFS family permease